MRAFIIKFFYLQYYIKFLGKTLTPTRSSIFIVPAMCAGGMFSKGDKLFFTYLFAAIVVIFWVFPLIYFKYRPAKWSELSLDQKWFASKLKKLPKGYFNDYSEHIKSIEYLNFYNILPIVIQLISVTIAIIYFLNN